MHKYGSKGALTSSDIDYLLAGLRQFSVRYSSVTDKKLDEHTDDSGKTINKFSQFSMCFVIHKFHYCTSIASFLLHQGIFIFCKIFNKFIVITRHCNITCSYKNMDLLFFYIFDIKILNI